MRSISKSSPIGLFLLTLMVSIGNVFAYDDPIKTTFPHSHLSWTINETRFDFVFSTIGFIQNISKLESDSSNYLTNSLASCYGHSACLFEAGKLKDHLKLKKEKAQNTYHRSFFISEKGIETNNQKGFCDQNEFTITHYCSTHWNPPTYLYRNKCSHIIEWHSPLTCHVNSTSYERPCYIYDPKGNLIDLTPWIRSDGSSYKVNTTFMNIDKNDAKRQHSNQFKGFNINVCNEAFDMCGPDISACFIDPEQGGLVEAGYNNLTSISLDAKDNKTILLTSQGHYKEQCESSRIKTVIRFVCKKKLTVTKAIDNLMGPKLIRSDGCTNVVEWETIQACPLIETKRPVLPDCKIGYESLGIEIDVRQLIKNMDMVEVPNIETSNKKMLLGICKSLPKGLRCGGKQVSSTSACLIDTNDSSFERKANNSQIVGTIIKSTLRLADDRLYLESTTVNSTCSTAVKDNRGSFNVTRQVGVRIEFFCSTNEQNTPTYLGFDDCSYVFEWASPLMCFESITPLLAQEDINKGLNRNKLGNLIPAPTSIETLSPKPPTSDRTTKNIALNNHKSTLEDATKINQAVIHHEEFHPPGVPAVTPSKSSTTETKYITPETKTQANVNVAKLEQPKMNVIHKFFMISLIIMSLVSFLVIILVLDKKTRLRIPLGAIRRQARQTFQSQPVPYSRVVNDLDL